MTSRRMIDPSIWQSETVASLSMRQRLLFIGLFSNANDQGRLRAHPALVRSLVFPYDDVSLQDMADDLDALAAADCVLLYEVDGKRCLQLVNWWAYQSPQWAYPSKIPAPDGWADRLRYRRENKVLTDNWAGESLPKALPKALPEPLDCGDSIRVSVSTSGREDIPPSGEKSPALQNEPEPDDDIEWNTPAQVEPKAKEERLQDMRDAVGADVLEGVVKAYQTVQPDDWQGLADVFCDAIHGLHLLDMTESDQKNWPRKLKTIAEGMGVSPAQMELALRVMPKKESGFAFKVPGSYSSPYAKAFEPDIKIIIAKLAVGQIGPKADNKKPIVVNAPTGAPKWMKT